ncbi:MAG: AMP-binding protein, partial [Pricia sp.]
MKSLYRKVHSHFRLNVNAYTRKELKEVAYSYIKEGESYEAEIGEFLLDWLDDGPTLEVHTSGSTGKPKRITLQKQHMVNSAIATGDFFGLQAGDSALLCLPASYIAGKMMLVRAIVLGLELDCVPPSSKPLDGVVKSYDFGAMVPLQLENSLDDLGQIKTLIVGG